MADAEPQRAFCHLEILQETGLSCTGGGGRGTGKRCLGELGNAQSEEAPVGGFLI